MIDPLTEEVILPPAAARIFPKGPNGKHPHVSFVYRAMQRGCRGVVLESIRTPKLATSREAVARFICRLTEQAEPIKTSVGLATAPERDRRQVEQELDRLGF
jgi:hypothetical protein